MPRPFFGLLAVSALGGCAAFGQGTFGQIAYGGCWQTTFTLINMNTTTANVTLNFYGDNGSPVAAPVLGVGNRSVYTFAIPAGGDQNVVLQGLSTDPTVAGWANMTTDGTSVRGQGTFRCQISPNPTFEAVVPLTSTGSTSCIIGFPPPPDPVILVPFDNTNGYVTSLAFANTTNTALPVSIEFDDQSNQKLVADTLNFGAMTHTSFVTTTNYPALAGKKGILRIHAGTANLSIIGLLSNPTGAFTTILPVTQ